MKDKINRDIKDIINHDKREYFYGPQYILFKNSGNDWAETNKNFKQVFAAAEFEVNLNKTATENLDDLKSLIGMHGEFHLPSPYLFRGRVFTLENSHITIWVKGVAYFIKRREYLLST